jgi:membrane peptidoglycan carboxypeptidase
MQRVKGLVSNSEKRTYLFGYAILIALILYAIAFVLAGRIHAAYVAYESRAILDRNDDILTLYPNERDLYVRYSDSIPLRVQELLIRKEDKYFRSHLGINLVSSTRALINTVIGNSVGGASTITQQLVKNMLGNLENRSLSNKLIESIYAVSLTLTTSKDDVLRMYANTVFISMNHWRISTIRELPCFSLHFQAQALKTLGIE